MAAHDRVAVAELEPSIDRLDAAFAAWAGAQTDAVAAMVDAVRTGAAPSTEVDLAEGYRWITRLTSLAQEWFIEKAVDPLHPQMFRCQDETRKLMVDNPDVTYWFAALDDSRGYRLTGRRGEAVYIGLTFGSPIFLGGGKGGQGLGTLAQHHLDEFNLDDDGRFDIVIAPERPAGWTGDFITLVSGIGQLAVRETHADARTERRTDWRIELLEAEPAPVLETEWLATKLELASLFVAFVAATCRNMWIEAGERLNVIGGKAGAEHVADRDDEVKSHSSADMEYHGGRFALGEDEALVVTVTAPKDFVYWGLTIVNPWMESHDYLHRQVNLNFSSAERSTDGTWRLVIAAQDPGVTNWIDTGGRREGYVLVRWCLAPGARPPECELVRLAEL